MEVAWHFEILVSYHITAVSNVPFLLSEDDRATLKSSVCLFNQTVDSVVRKYSSYTNLLSQIHRTTLMLLFLHKSCRSAMQQCVMGFVFQRLALLEFY
jgi:hypothetical protein